MRTIHDAIAEALRGKKSMVKCPAHEDSTASLSVGPGRSQPVVFHCHAGCEATRQVPDGAGGYRHEPGPIMEAAGITFADVCRPEDPTATEEWTPAGPASNVYSYVDGGGVELFQVLRVPKPGGGKQMMQRHWNHEEGKWTWNIQDVPRVLYRLHEVRQAVADGETIYVVEGEKDVEALRFDGYTATTNPGGAGKWDESFSEALRGATVVVIQDADEPGRKHGRHVAESLVEHECVVTVLETMLAGCKDYSDHRAKGGTLTSLSRVWTSERQERPTYGLGIQDFLLQDLPEEVEVIPGVLAYSNVALITGFEGHGKTTLLRQIAACCAGGIHPFFATEMPKRRVLHIDAENPEHQQMYDWSWLAGLVAYHTGEAIENDNLTILSEWRIEPDLLSPAGQAWLYERIEAYRPEIVTMGPVQNLVSRDVKDDEVVRKFKHAVNTARSMYGTAFIIEHHAPHRMAGDSERSTRPYGSSLFQKWPDFGYGLRPVKDEEGVYELHPNRKPRVRSRAWPERIRWGKPGTREFPWEQAEPESAGSVVRGSFGRGGAV